MPRHEHNAFNFHLGWEDEGWVLIRVSPSCPEQVDKDTSCYEGTKDPDEAATWLIEQPARSYYIKGSKDRYGNGGGWTKVSGYFFTDEVKDLTWEPSIAAAMSIEAHRKTR